MMRDHCRSLRNVMPAAQESETWSISLPVLHVFQPEFAPNDRGPDFSKKLCFEKPYAFDRNGFHPLDKERTFVDDLLEF